MAACSKEEAIEEASRPERATVHLSVSPFEILTKNTDPNHAVKKHIDSVRIIDVLVFREGSDEKTELVYTDRVAPATGDAGQLLLYCGMTVTAAAALAVFSALRSRRKKKENA